MKEERTPEDDIPFLGGDLLCEFSVISLTYGRNSCDDEN